MLRLPLPLPSMVETRAQASWRIFQHEVALARGESMPLRVMDLGGQTPENHLAVASVQYFRRLKDGFAERHMPTSVWAGFPVVTVHGDVDGSDHCPARDVLIEDQETGRVLQRYKSAPENQWVCQLMVHVYQEDGARKPSSAAAAADDEDHFGDSRDYLANRVRETHNWNDGLHHFVAVWCYSGHKPETLEDRLRRQDGGGKYEDPHGVYAVYFWDTLDVHVKCIWGLPVWDDLGPWHRATVH